MITVQFKGLDETIAKLKKQGQIQSKVNEFLELLGAVGITVAATEFKYAQYDGTNDVVVSPHVEFIGSNEAKITAYGNAVLFIEFGTGITYTEQHPLADELNMQRGTYGQGKGNFPTWEYYGEPGTHGEIKDKNDNGVLVKTYGNPPAMAMYKADREMRKKVKWAVKEVFTDD